MKKKRYGFTLIEVAIFLAVTGALFVAVTVGVQNSIYQQRQNDAVQNFAEFLRSLYSQVTNVESEGSGNSDYAIYGKLLTIGESRDLAGQPNNKNALFSYSVVGKIEDTGGDNVLQALANLDANVVRFDEGSSKYRALGLAEGYVPRWASAIQNADSYSLFKGAVLIVRHPSSGTVYTYVMNGETIEVNDTIRKANMGSEVVPNVNPLTKPLKENSFAIKEVNFCLNMEGNVNGGRRFDIRLVKNARNASGVEIATDENNKCEGK